MAEDAGSLRLRVGCFRVVQKNRAWLDDPDRLYLRLLESCAMRYNGAYTDQLRICRSSSRPSPSAFTGCTVLAPPSGLLDPAGCRTVPGFPFFI